MIKGTEAESECANTSITCRHSARHGLQGYENSVTEHDDAVLTFFHGHFNFLFKN